MNLVRILFCFSFVFSGSLFALSKPSSLEKNLSKKRAIGVSTFSYMDEERRRPITVELWYPTEEKFIEILPDSKKEGVWVHPVEIRDAAFSKAKKNLPLVMMSHGHGGDRRDRSWLAEKLVLNGFVVASIDHYGNTWQTMNTVATLKFWERPQDVSFAISSLIEEPSLQERIDASRIGFVGYSLGGLTGLALAGGVAQDMEVEVEKNRHHFPELTPDVLSSVDLSLSRKSYFDQRIKAVLLLAPATWCFGKSKSIQSLKTPVGIVGTVTDEVLAFQEHLEPLIIQSVPARLKLLRHGESHFIFLNRVTEQGRKVLSEKIFKDPDGVDRRLIHSEIADFAVEFFHQFLE